MKTRLNKLLGKHKTKVDIRPRHKELLKLEGWYDVHPQYTFQHQLVYNKYRESGSTLKFTRWALRNNLISEQEATDIGKFKPRAFKLSCKYNDLLRLADTPHYGSCYSGNNGLQQIQYLADPDIAVLYIPDAAGKFMWRALVRLVIVDEGYGLVMCRAYGNGPTVAIRDELQKVLPIFYAAYDFDINAITLTSPTKLNNEAILRPIWSDHELGVSKGRLTIKATSTNPDSL